MKVTRKNNRVTIQADGLPAVWFYENEEVMNIPSPLIKSPKQARAFAELINKAASEWDYVKFLRGSN